MKIDIDKLNESLAQEKKLIMQQRKSKMGNSLVVARLEGMLLGLAIFLIHLEESEVNDNAKI